MIEGSRAKPTIGPYTAVVLSSTMWVLLFVALGSVGM